MVSYSGKLANAQTHNYFVFLSAARWSLCCPGNLANVHSRYYLVFKPAVPYTTVSLIVNINKSLFGKLHLVVYLNGQLDA